MAADCPILCVITIPEVITLVHTTLFSIEAVVKALGVSRNLTVSPSKTEFQRLAKRFHAAFVTLIRLSHSYSRRLPALG